MRRPIKLALAGATLAAATAGGAGVAAAGLVDGDTPITGPALEQASSAALDHVGEGRVTDTEVGDEDSYYEVEVRRDDGSQIDVQLDRGFAVVGDGVDRADHDD